MTQTRMVEATLRVRYPDLTVGHTRITTKGDLLLDRPLASLGDKGLFIAEIEDAMREGRVDLAVHSAKDLPSTLPPDMRIAAILPRADARDALVSAWGALEALPAGARVGTSSPRRACQLRALRPDLTLLDVRGNVDTRLKKMASGAYDALVLAMAGLERLDLTHGAGAARVIPFAQERMLSAPGQGALAIEICAAREDVAAWVAPLNHPETEAAVRAERAVLAAVGGGCASAVAAFASILPSGAALYLQGMIGAADGRTLRGELTGPVDDGTLVAQRLVADLLARGGAALLRATASPASA